MDVWFWIWIVAAAALYIGEMLTTSFYLLPFAVGATAAWLANLLHGPLWLQWTLCIAVSLLALVLLRPIAKRIQNKENPAVGVDRLVGMLGEIIEGNAPAGEQRVRVAREVWNATVLGEQNLPIGTYVQVVSVDGVHLVVCRAQVAYTPQPTG